MHSLRQNFRTNPPPPIPPLIHRKKKVREFPVPSRDVITELSLSGNNGVITELFLPRGSLVSDIPAGDGKLLNLFLRCTHNKIPLLIIWGYFPDYYNSLRPMSL
jgi:hypothetical protein